MSVPRGWGGGGGRGLGGIPMEGCLWKWIGVGSDIWKKTINVCIVHSQIACAFEQANQSLLFTF